MVAQINFFFCRVHLEAGNSMNDTEVNKTISQMVRYVVCLGASSVSARREAPAPGETRRSQ